jgi:hypothetical protein
MNSWIIQCQTFFSTVLLTIRRKIRQQEFDSVFVFVCEGKDKDLLLKNPMRSMQYVRLITSFIY